MPIDAEKVTNLQKTMREIEQFAELTFAWNSDNFETPSDLIYYGRVPIVCTLPSPNLTVVDTPLKVKILN